MYLCSSVSVQGDPKPPSTKAGNNSFPEDFTPSLKVFTIAELETAKCQGSFEMGYIGWVDKNTFAPSSPGIGIVVTVERYYSTTYRGRNQMLADLSLQVRLAHPNIISLFGYCKVKEHEFLLVKEYVEERTFEQFIFRDAAKPLSWRARLGVMIGVARGLTCLHSSKFICHFLPSFIYGWTKILSQN